MKNDNELPEASIEETRRLSVVWLLPIVAALVGAWLAYDTLEQRGPTISIAFQRGEGIEAGKTTLQYKAIQVGKVMAVHIADDLQHVIATARVEKSFATQLNEGTRFWVVRPRVGASGVSGLGTLVSGAYIEIDPGEGPPRRNFIGLETPPIVSDDVPGNQYILQSDRLGSLLAGAPVLFRDIPVGEVLGYKLADDGDRVTVHIFIREPYTLLVRGTTKFSHASGIDVTVTADGLELTTSSLQTLLVGGVSFDSPPGSKEVPSPPGTKFWLYDSVEKTAEIDPSEQIPYRLYFDESVRGLSVGAPVEFKGIRLGSVTKIELEVGETPSAINVPVTIAIQGQRLAAATATVKQDPNAIIGALIEEGFRARLQTGSFLTGQMFVELGFYPDTPATLVRNPTSIAQIPTVPSELAELKLNASEVLDNLRKLPLEEIGEQSLATITSLESLIKSPQIGDVFSSAQASLESIQSLTSDLNARLVPLTSRLHETLASVDKNSALQSQLSTTLKHVDAAARALRVLAESIERNPNAVIWGKKKSQPVLIEEN